jgi:Mrp family chromosome partitioning ATPase
MLRVALGIRDAMRESRTGTTGRSLLVTGSGHSEGKSSSALNLASVIATSGSSVILVEADLRRPSLGTALRFKAPHGVASVLMGELDLEDALVQIDEEGRLRVLLVEPTAQYLAESPLAAGLGDIIEAATQMADYVIVDAPPVTEVSDAVPLARQVDDVLVVARLGSSRVDRLEDLGEILAREGIRPVGILVVGGNRRSGSEYYADPPGGGRGGLLRGRRRERTAPLRA